MWISYIKLRIFYEFQEKVGAETSDLVLVLLMFFMTHFNISRSSSPPLWWSADLWRRLGNIILHNPRCEEHFFDDKRDTNLQQT